LNADQRGISLNRKAVGDEFPVNIRRRFTFLASRFRKLMLIGILAWLGCAAAGFSASAGLIPVWIVFIPFIAFFAVVRLMLVWIRCPRCGGPFGQNAGFLNWRDCFYQRRVNFCPYCGVNLDDRGVYGD
jgi:hypothetical protein